MVGEAVGVEHVNIVLALFGGAILLLNAFSTSLQRVSLTAPLLALLLGVAIGPYGLDVVTLEQFGVAPPLLLEETARLTLAVALTGVALRLPHGYWSDNRRWVVAIIGAGMFGMWAVSTGLLWATLGVPFTVALLLGAIVTPTDPVVSTPIVTGSVAEQRIPARVRHNISAESGLNDGLAVLFVFLPLLLLTEPTGAAWHEWATHVLLREVVGACLLGGIGGYLVARLFVWVTTRGLMEASAYSGFVVALALFLLGLLKLLGANAILGVFVAVAVFGQVVTQADESEENRQSEIINRFFIIPIFILLGVGLPLEAWAGLGVGAPVALLAAVVGRRLVAVWAIRPGYADLHSRAETGFLSWFGPIGVSALYYALVAERETGRSDLFPYVTLAIAGSVLVHGLTASPAGAWLHRQSQ